MNGTLPSPAGMGESAGLLAVFEPEAKNDFIWAVVGSPWGLLACWLILINVVTFCAFGLDKWKAKRKEKKESVRRIPEKRLLALAALGGSVGALLGMRAFRHKTLALQILIPFGLWLYFHVIR